MINFFIILAIVSILIFLRMKYLDLYKKFSFFILVSIIFIMVFYMVLYPSDIIEAARDGISLWANVVFPSLLPFFIGAELLVGLGAVKFIGVLIEPVIRPLFNVPGEASFVFAMSITSGYPMGVKLTSDLRRNNIVTKSEAQRIISFCSTSGPLFMIGAVAIGMFNNPEIGPYMALSHYLGAITIGIILRFIDHDFNTNYDKSYGKINIFKRAFSEMLNERSKDGRTIGKLLGDSVKESISTLIIVGGLIVTFSVLTRELYLMGFFNYMGAFINSIFKNNINVSHDVIEAILTGSIEITMGCKITSEALIMSPISQITLATMIISWSGLSIHAQAASIVNDTDINLKFYVLSKFFHSIISGIYVYTFLKISNFNFTSSQTEVFSEKIENIINYTLLNRLFFSLYMFLIVFIALVLAGILIGILKKN